MNLLADEGVDRQVVDLLREKGHSVSYVAEMEPGVQDEDVLDQANRENRVLLTADRDFGELVFRQGRLSAGVVLVPLSGLTPESKAYAVASTFEEYAADFAPGTFAVIAPGAVRIRRTHRHEARPSPTLRGEPPRHRAHKGGTATSGSAARSARGREAG